VVGAGTIGHRAAGATVTPTSALTGKHRTVNFFYRFSGERHARPAPAADYSKAPPPRKSETPPTRRVLVVGDSMADWLGYGLDEKYADHPEIGVDRKIWATSGLIQYDAKNVSLDWPQAIKDTLSNEKPNAIVVMLGLTTLACR